MFAAVAQCVLYFTTNYSFEFNTGGGASNIEEIHFLLFVAKNGNILGAKPLTKYMVLVD